MVGEGVLFFSHLVQERDDGPYAGSGENDQNANPSDYEPHHDEPPGV